MIALRRNDAVMLQVRSKGGQAVSRMLQIPSLFLTLATTVLLASLMAGCGGNDSFTEAPPDDDTNGTTPPPTETITGSGSDVVPFTIGTSGAVTFNLVHAGDGTFVVWLLDSSAERLVLLTAKVGDVSDTRVENLAAGSYFLDIESTGEWSVSITGSAGGTPGTDPATLPLAKFAAPRPGSQAGPFLEMQSGEWRNAAIILDSDRPPAPTGGLRINYVLVDDPTLIQVIEEQPKSDGEPPDGTAKIEGIVEVNNAEPITIAGGDFAVTFQVKALNSGRALLILIGGDGYTAPVWPDPLGTLEIVVEQQ